MSKRGVLLINLGSPDSPQVADVRRYLGEFLMDGRVIDIPWLWRFLIVNCFILPFRPRKSAEAYHKIWGREGSPLVVMSRRLQQLLQKRLPMPVELAMRYQNPSVSAAIRNLQDRGVEELLLVPLFPHYAMSSYETAVVHVKGTLEQLAPGLRLKVLAPYYTEPEYIEALVASAESYLKADYDQLLFSFHGIPERHVIRTDPTGSHCLKVANCCQVSSKAHEKCYRAQCFKTVEAFTRRAGVSKYSVSFQSRLGRDPWLQPYTDVEFVRLAREGVRKIKVICPAFVADCLETLEEIGMRGRETFLEAGGKEFEMIPCLNDHPQWVSGLEKMILRLAQSEGQT